MGRCMQKLKDWLRQKADKAQEWAVGTRTAHAAAAARSITAWRLETERRARSRERNLKYMMREHKEEQKWREEPRTRRWTRETAKEGPHRRGGYPERGLAKGSERWQKKNASHHGEESNREEARVDGGKPGPVHTGVDPREEEPEGKTPGWPDYREST